jgi:hypothetical protein
MTVRRKNGADLKTRFTFCLTATQLMAICEDATRLGISTGEIGRRILDDWLATRPRNELPPRAPAADSVAEEIAIGGACSLPLN